MNRRALLVAFVLATMGAGLLFFYIQRFEREASGGEKVRLLATVKPLERGAVITEDAISAREVPQAYVEDRAIKYIDRQKIIGLKVGNGMAAQQTLMWSDLAVANDERRDLSSLIQPGNRAMAVRATNDDKSFALIRPGDYVDVVATMAATADKPDTKVAIVLLQRVLVLAVGLDTEARTAEGTARANSQDLILSLSVNLQEAQLLALAMDKGKLSVVLRNPSDPRVIAGIPDMNSSALTDTKTRSEVQVIRQKGPIKIEGPKQ
ncbi:MAG: Flp pilus assembly protein CpaB [Myxococcales bacterium]|nr:Flp pilus assembly protein CpaB [Polyangiaceae bacterium]MDW8248674.1 Flp pilus assembly protein CpaB [Myxococcales bacterium]